MNADLTTGSLLLASAVALAAGLVSFASPCVLPLVPGFLGYVTGLSDESLERRSRGRLVVGALLFVAGFTVVFLIAAAALSAIGVAFREHQSALLRIGGVVVIVMGLLFLGVGKSYAAQLGWRPRAGLLGAPLLGAAFAVGWSPCWGPTLGAIQAMAAPISAEAGSIGRGLILGAVYSIGLGLPFILGAIVLLTTFIVPGESSKVKITSMVIIGLVSFGWPVFARMMRAAVISARSQDYVIAARALGASNARIIWRHLLPNCLAPLLVLSTVAATAGLAGAARSASAATSSPRRRCPSSASDCSIR